MRLGGTTRRMALKASPPEWFNACCATLHAAGHKVQIDDPVWRPSMIRRIRFIDPALHQIQFNIVVCCFHPILHLFCRHRFRRLSPPPRWATITRFIG